MSLTQLPICDFSVASEAARAAATDCSCGGGRFGLAAHRGDFGAGGGEPFVVGVDPRLQRGDPLRARG